MKSGPEKFWCVATLFHQYQTENIDQACAIHIGLSGTGGAELASLKNELQAFSTNELSEANKDNVLRFKAVLERGVRLA